METFTITQDHLKLLRRMYVCWDDGEFGAPAIDPKRPYGNSGVSEDIAEILGWPVDDDGGLTDNQYEQAKQLHGATQHVLQICLQEGTFDVLGSWSKPNAWGNWRRT